VRKNGAPSYTWDAEFRAHLPRERLIAVLEQSASENLRSRRQAGRMRTTRFETMGSTHGTTVGSGFLRFGSAERATRCARSGGHPVMHQWDASDLAHGYNMMRRWIDCWMPKQALAMDDTVPCSGNPSPTLSREGRGSTVARACVEAPPLAHVQPPPRSFESENRSKLMTGVVAYTETTGIPAHRIPTTWRLTFGKIVILGGR